MLLFATLAGLAGLAIHRARKNKSGGTSNSKIGVEQGPLVSGMTAERTIAYQNALQSVKDPNKLRTLAAVYRKSGLAAQADMLEKRAKLRELPKEVSEARRAAFKKGMASKDSAAILNLANAFDSEGATGAADQLRQYAQGLEQ